MEFKREFFAIFDTMKIRGLVCNGVESMWLEDSMSSNGSKVSWDEV